MGMGETVLATLMNMTGTSNEPLSYQLSFDDQNLTRKSRALYP